MGWHVFSFDRAESVDSQWAILYMYDPCSLYMNKCGFGRLVERQTVIEEIYFHINTKTYYHFCLIVQVSAILCRNQICFSMPQHLLVPKCPLHHHYVVNCLACYQLVPCSLVWRLYKPKCETKPTACRSRGEGTFYVITFCVRKSSGTQFEWY